MNIAEILRHCPKGTKLYSTIFGEVTLDKIDMHDMYPIVVHRFNHLKTSFDKEGHYLEDYPGTECVLFPSKEQRNWEKFRLPVKKGDIMMTEDKRAFIADGKMDDSGCPCAYCGLDLYHNFTNGSETNGWTALYYMPASEEAKKRLFDKIEEAGYKWNADTLELEKVVPKFKNKFKPFDKVLVKDGINEEWSINLFSYYDREDQDYPYVCISGRYEYCIPYEGNEYLVGKTVNIKKI